MKLTLFTISNEQIKEQLSKLQTKVESLETVKDVQDKIISSKDSQITFLQGEISNITSWVTWGAGVVITLASAAFIFIKLLESKAKKKIESAENALQLATEQLEEIENTRRQTKANLSESDSKIEQLDLLIDKSNDIATVAQESLNNLAKRQKELTSLSTNLINIQKAIVILNSVDNMLYYIENNLHNVKSEIFESHLKPSENQLVTINHYSNKYHHLRFNFTKALTKFNNDTKEDQEISISDLEAINHLEQQVKKLNTDILNNLYGYDQD